MTKSRQDKIKALGEVIDTLDILRVKCPWDRKQTNESLRPNTIEETYELCSALTSGNNDEIKKELGDVLLHVLFYAKIGEESGAFDIADVATSLNRKLIFRHPHIFGNVEAKDADTVAQNWEQIKLKEKGGNRSVLAGVPTALPSLIKSYRIQEKAANVGFDWDNDHDVVSKIKEEIAEFEAEVNNGTQTDMENEFGDLLFSLVNLGRHLGINADNALERTNEKFIRRFNYIEAKANEMRKPLGDMSLEEMDRLWNKAKSEEPK